MSQTTLVQPATSWRIDPAHSSVEFAVRHLMITTVKGRFGSVTGHVEDGDTNPGGPLVDVSIEAASIDTRNEQRDAHLRSPDFFDVESFPTLRFVGRSVRGNARGKFQLEGDLTIRGVTRTVVLEVTFEGSARDPWGGERLSYSAASTIKRSEWDLNWNQKLETGGVVVSDDVRILLDVQLVSGD